MLISVIIPVYKVEAFIEECIDSVLGQSYKEIEVFLVDDGSPDNCPAICDFYAKKDSRVMVIHKQNGGLSDARNAGLDKMEGDYVLFLDSDDWWVDNKALEDLVSIINAYHWPDLVVFDRITYASDGRVMYPNSQIYRQINELPFDDAIYELSRQGKFDISAATKIVKASVIQSNNIRFVKGIYSEDIDWSFNLFQFIHTIAALDRPIYCYRKRAGSISSSVAGKNIEDHLCIVENWADKVSNSTLFSEKTKLSLLGELCYQQFILRGNVLLVDNHNCSIKEWQRRINSLDWLAKYSLSKKTRIAYYCSKVLGKTLSSLLMSLYIRTKDSFVKV